MKNIQTIFLIFISLFYIPQAVSWNAVGHRLIAQIAYDNLSRPAKITFNRFNRSVDQG